MLLYDIYKLWHKVIDPDVRDKGSRLYCISLAGTRCHFTYGSGVLTGTLGPEVDVDRLLLGFSEIHVQRNDNEENNKPKHDDMNIDVCHYQTYCSQEETVFSFKSHQCHAYIFCFNGQCSCPEYTQIRTCMLLHIQES